MSVTLGTWAEVLGWDPRQQIQEEMEVRSLDDWAEPAYREQAVRSVEKQVVDAVRPHLPRQVTLHAGAFYATGPVAPELVRWCLDGVNLPRLIDEGVTDFFDTPRPKVRVPKQRTDV